MSQDGGRGHSKDDDTNEDAHGEEDDPELRVTTRVFGIHTHDPQVIAPSEKACD